MANEVIDSLELEEKKARSKSHIQEIEARWIDTLSEISPSEEEIFFVHYNRFRLRNLPVLKTKRPAILLGYINDHHFPNFHTRELLKIADIISLTIQETASPTIDRIFYFPAQDTFQTIRKKFPAGFKPNLYWDMQAVHGHIHPVGLSTNPFPAVASICHIQHGPAVKTAAEMFDYVVPVGKEFSPGISYGKAKVLHLPFGGNWASFDTQFHKQSLADEERDIDVSVTFSATDQPVYHGLRKKVSEVVTNLQSKWKGKYKIVIESSLAKREYHELLKRSKISLNVVGMNGPFNYRSCEIINAGALLLQINAETESFVSPINEYLQEDVHFSRFTVENLEDQILFFLENAGSREEIAKNGMQFLSSELNSCKILDSLLAEVRSFKRQSINHAELATNDRFLLGTFLWQQHHEEDTRKLGAAFLGQAMQEENDFLKLVSNLLAILPELVGGIGFEFLQNCISRHHPELAKSLDPHNLKQIAVQLFSVKMDHISFCYNFLALSEELNWSPREVLAPIAQQAFTGKTWDKLTPDWLLRPVNKSHSLPQGEIFNLQYKHFHSPLAQAKSKGEEWLVYRDYLMKLLGIASGESN